MQQSEILINNLNAYRHALKIINYKISKCKERYVYYHTDNKHKLLVLARYIINNMRAEDFDAKKCSDMIEEIENNDKLINAIETELSTFENQRADYAENIKCIEEYLCLR